MSFNSFIQFAIFLGVLVVLAVPLGTYMARVFDGRLRAPPQGLPFREASRHRWTAHRGERRTVPEVYGGRAHDDPGMGGQPGAHDVLEVSTEAAVHHFTPGSVCGELLAHEHPQPGPVFRGHALMGEPT